MRLGDVGAQAVANLARHKLRTILTLCGVAVGVSTLTVMVSLGEGLRRLIENQVDKADLVTRIDVLPPGTKAKLFGGMGPGSDDDSPKQKITDEVVADLQKLPGVAAVFPNVHTALGVELEGNVFFYETEGFPPEGVSETHRGALVVGRYWTKEDADAPVVVVPSSLLEELEVDPLKAVGMKVFFMNPSQLARYTQTMVPEVGGPTTTTDGKAVPPRMTRRFERPKEIELREARVIGVYNSDEFGMSGRRFHAPLTFGKTLLDESGMQSGFGGIGLERGEYRAIVVKAESRTQVADLRKHIEARGFETFAVQDMLKAISIVFTIIDVLLGFFGSIGLVVSFFGIANTMVMAVLERTREIGVLKALGARDRDVRRVFLLEAAGIGVAGGALGVGVGWLVGVCLNALASHLLHDSLGDKGVAIFYVPGWLAGASIGLSTFVAGVAGLYPAWRAARLDPVVSLRME
jgi:ABC-type antimicrobial peptide transport system permease subunit